MIYYANINLYPSWLACLLSVSGMRRKGERENNSGRRLRLTWVPRPSWWCRRTATSGASTARSTTAIFAASGPASFLHPSFHLHSIHTVCTLTEFRMPACRSYFRCKSKSCGAKKKVEWHPSHPDDLRILYEGSHDHHAAPSPGSTSAANQYDLSNQVFGSQPHDHRDHSAHWIISIQLLFTLPNPHFN